MKGYHIGELEELILLTIASMAEDQYGVRIKQVFEEASGRKVNISAVHAALYRMEDKGFLSSGMSESTNIRGGKRKRIFTLTNAGLGILRQSKELRETLWQKIPQLS